MLRALNRKIAWAVVSLAIAQAASCKAEAHKPEEHGDFAVTTPLTRDTDVDRDFVCQIHAIHHIELRALEGGYLQNTYVDEGAPVEKGQRMFQIMPMIYQAELQMAAAELDYTNIEYKNTKLLADKSVVSPNELALAKAKVDKAKAEVSLSRAHKGFTEVRAPFSGMMGRLHVQVGSLLEEGEELTTLSDNSRLWVYFNVTESDYLDYQRNLQKSGGGEAVHLIMANGEVFEHAGEIETIDAEFNHETGTVAFRAGFPNPDLLLRHGETGKVRLTTKLKDAVLIPQKTTFEVLDRLYVFVVDDQGRVHARQIVVAEELDHLYVIRSGLEKDEKILVEGLRHVSDGDVIHTHLVDPAQIISELAIPAE